MRVGTGRPHINLLFGEFLIRQPYLYPDKRTEKPHGLKFAVSSEPPIACVPKRMASEGFSVSRPFIQNCFISSRPHSSTKTQNDRLASPQFAEAEIL